MTGSAGSVPVVEVSQGRLRGYREGDSFVFKGVPFAAPPFGRNRFQRPVSPDRWIGERPALDFGPVPPQPRDLVIARAGSQPAYGEDCLTLNIWTPTLAQDRLPVLVYIPGGAYIAGSGSQPLFRGAPFARDGVVLVTINYRVGVDGFGNIGQEALNLGLRDQIAALTWVHDNISVFGGDPDRVTIYGESAGAGSAALLLAMPAAEGLFQRAILGSPVPYVSFTPERSAQIGAEFAAHLGVEPTQQGIESCSFSHLVSAEFEFKASYTDFEAALAGRSRLAQDWFRMSPFGPVVGDESLPAMPDHPSAIRTASSVQVLAGYNVEETRLFMMSSGAIRRVDAATVERAGASLGLSPDGVAAYQHQAGNEPGDAFSQMWTDWGFRIPALRLAEAHLATGGTTYLYEFDGTPRETNGGYGSCHLVELPFIFEALDLPAMEDLLGPNPSEGLATKMHRAWVDFATTGDPGWEPYQTSTRPTMCFTSDSQVTSDPGGEQRSLWDNVPLGPGTEASTVGPPLHLGISKPTCTSRHT